jgi:hypothetical protein
MNSTPSATTKVISRPSPLRAIAGGHSPAVILWFDQPDQPLDQAVCSML